ncbi:MAG: arsenite methyltransferase [Gemmatimonadetes bacterium]|nr:arsenite methyltransferase [Gemmatimonadota bacterium]
MSEVAVAAVSVRPAASADLEAVQALLRTADLPIDGVADQFDYGYVVSEVGGTVMGVAGLEVYGSYGLLRSVAVAPEWRGRGVAAALVADRVEWGAVRGLRAIYLLTTTAKQYFGEHGFAVIDRDDVPAAIRRSAEFAKVCPSTATAMELRIAARASSCCGAQFTNAIDTNDAEGLKAAVREKYGSAASRAAGGAKSSCCGDSPDEVWDPITADLYEDAETQGLPAEALLASLGCGNPTALAELHEGEVVLDLGSGGGIDVLLSARRVGPTGRAYGLDMTDEMLELARANQARAGAANVEFLKGDIEAIPLPDASVDVIISNCVINLAADKAKVLREAFRVLRPGGRFAVSDIVVTREVPAPVRRSMELWMGCVAGALHRDEYMALLAEAGFEDIDLEPTRVYNAADADAFGVDTGISGAELDGAFMSAFVRARRPGS